MAVNSALSQQLRDEYILKIIVVNDGSSKDSLDYINTKVADVAQIVTHEENMGRGNSINTGVSKSDSDYIIFMDSDCVFYDKDAIYAHIQALERGADVSFGVVSSEKKGFWGDYTRFLEHNRIREAGQECNYLVLTSANLAIKRSVFERLGGFDKRYKKYGFEDRDLIARLLDTNANISFNPDIVVLHDGDSNLRVVSRKMMEAGRYTSQYFIDSHLKRYLEMPYSKIDVRIHPIGFLLLSKIMIMLLPTFIFMSSMVISSKYYSNSFKRFLVKAVSASSFMIGTFYSRRDMQDD